MAIYSIRAKSLEVSRGTYGMIEGWVTSIFNLKKGKHIKGGGITFFSSRFLGGGGGRLEMPYSKNVIILPKNNKKIYDLLKW